MWRWLPAFPNELYLGALYSVGGCWTGRPEVIVVFPVSPVRGWRKEEREQPPIIVELARKLVER